MTMHFVLTAIGDVTAGMVLADDLLDLQGHVLLPKGAALSPAMIEALHRHQVDVVPVSTGETTAEENLMEQSQFAERIALLFRKVPEDDTSAIAVVRQYIRDYRLGVSV